MAHDPCPFFAEERSIDDRFVVRIGGECDAATLDQLNETLEAAIDQRPHEVVVDLAEATFVDSLTLGSLAAAAKRTRARMAVLSASSGLMQPRYDEHSRSPASTHTSSRDRGNGIVAGRQRRVAVLAPGIAEDY